MRRDLADIVCCPVHKSRLALRVDESDARGDIVRGVLHCAQCPFDYPIEDSIPNLLPPEYHADEVREAKPGARGPAKEGKGKGAGAARRAP